MTRLWIHECFRVFSDRLINDKDREAFVGILTEKLGNLFDQTFHNICPNKQPPIFGKLLFFAFLNTAIVSCELHCLYGEVELQRFYPFVNLLILLLDRN